ncbi:MAG: hypothetical protein V1668_01465 [Patescibacteria group bacterium]
MNFESMSGPEVLRAVLDALSKGGQSFDIALSPKELDEGGVVQKISSSTGDVHNPISMGLITYRSYVIKTYSDQAWIFSLGQGPVHPVYSLQSNLIGARLNNQPSSQTEESVRTMIGYELTFTLLTASDQGLIATINEFDQRFEKYQALRERLSVSLKNRLSEFIIKLPASVPVSYSPAIVPWLTQLMEKEIAFF